MVGDSDNEEDSDDEEDNDEEEDNDDDEEGNDDDEEEAKKKYPKEILDAIEEFSSKVFEMAQELAAGYESGWCKDENCTMDEDVPVDKDNGTN